jgi:hypothetical protein
MIDTRYYVDKMATPILLRRRTGHLDEKFMGGKWKPTMMIIDYDFGHNVFVDDISEAQARKLAPDAFT